jgi:hypothetical protein
LIILRRHAPALLLLAAFTAVWLFPLLSHPSSLLPGASGGDNDTFVWNLWWMRYVLRHQPQSFFFTPFLFHPFGADLTLHTHTALPALVAALTGPSSVVASQNLLIVLHLFLNFACSYALAYRATRGVLPALAGSVIFGTSCFVGGHLLGHFNLIAAWTLPLVCLLVEVARERASAIRAGVAGFALAATAYVDYYLFVFAAGIVLISWIAGSVRALLRPQPLSRRSRYVVAGFAAVMALDLLIIGVILLWPGDHIDFGSIHISVRSVSNPVTAAWLLLIAASVVAAAPRFERRRQLSAAGVRVPVTLIATTAILLIPLFFHATRIWVEGRYVSQTYFWRSAPAGIDLATLALGSPYHALWGESVRRICDALHIDAIERCGWMPVAAIILSVVAVAARRGDPVVSQWTVVGVAFLTWALGPWLTAFGHQTPLILPATLIRFVPIVANARIPGRAMVVVYLALSMLAALGLARLMSEPSRRRAAWGLVILLLLESIPARPPFAAPDMPLQYALLKTRDTSGAVCELPLGLRDGFGETGSFDSSVLLHQMMHERPIVGGFLARLPPSLARNYARMPVIGVLLRLSAGGKLSDEVSVLSPGDAASALAAQGIGFVVLDTRRASSDLIQFVQSGIALQKIGEEDGRVFYEVSAVGIALLEAAPAAKSQ